MEFRWLGIAEGATEDSRGALTLVALDQNVVIAGSLPTFVQRVFVVDIRAEPGEIPEGTAAVFDLQVENPSGKTVAATTEQASIGPFRYPNIPASLKAVAQMTFRAEEHGTYRISCEARIAEHLLQADAAIYVLEPPEQGLPT